MYMVALQIEPPVVTSTEEAPPVKRTATGTNATTGTVAGTNTGTGNYYYNPGTGTTYNLCSSRCRQRQIVCRLARHVKRTDIILKLGVGRLITLLTVALGYP